MKLSTLAYVVEPVEDTRGIDRTNGNVDVLVRFETGDVFAATFFTLTNIETLMERYRRTGECANGSYFWSSSMVIVENLERATIERAVADLIASGEFELAFEGGATHAGS